MGILQQIISNAKKTPNDDETYHQFVLDKIQKKSEFLSHVTIYNRRTFKVISLKYDIKDFAKESKNTYIYNSLKATSLLEDMQNDEKEYQAVFATITLPSEFHPLSNDKINPKYHSSNTIENGYQILQNYHRDVYKNFKIKDDTGKWVSVPVKYTLVIEPTQQMIPHSHAIYYVEKKYISQFKKHLRNCEKNNNIGHIKKIEVIELDKKDKDGNKENPTIKYLLKYFNKTAKEATKENPDFTFAGWVSKHRIIAFRCSRTVNINKKIFNKISMVEKIDYNKDNALIDIRKEYNTTNLLKIIDKLSDVDTTIIDLDIGVTRIKTVKSEFGKYHVEIEKEKTTIFNKDSEKEIKYYIRKLIITEIDTEKIIYDKSDTVAVYSKGDKFKVLNRDCYFIPFPHGQNKPFSHEPKI